MKKFFSLIILAGLFTGTIWSMSKSFGKSAGLGIQEGSGTVVVDGSGTNTSSYMSNGFTKNYNFSYWLGGEYTYSFDLPEYQGINIYDNWQKEIKGISLKAIDELGSKGHIARITNTLEWKWPNNFSLTAFANLTLNYIPAFCDTSLNWVPLCWKGAMACFRACGSVLTWAVDGPWLIVNACTGFLMPAAAFAICALSGAVCIAAIPCSILCFAAPMLTIGGSVDYHFWSNEILDTKLSLGLDLDGYHGIMHMGFCGVFTQGEVSATFSRLKLYAQAGYRLDVMNIVTSVSTAKGTAKEGHESRYVPAPYIRAGLMFKIAQ